MSLITLAKRALVALFRPSCEEQAKITAEQRRYKGDAMPEFFANEIKKQVEEDKKKNK